MTIQEGLALKEAGQQQVSDHNPDWVELIRLRAWQIWTLEGVVSTDELHSYCAIIGEPKHPNAWGAVFRKGIGDDGYWRNVGRKISERKSAHAREIKTWTYVSPGEENA